MRNIREVTNGWILTQEIWSSDRGDYTKETVSHTLKDLLPSVGEGSANDAYSRYAPGCSVSTFDEVRYELNQGRKISAIKLMRALYTPTMPLREAKDLVEFMMSLMAEVTTVEVYKPQPNNEHIPVILTDEPTLGEMLAAALKPKKDL